MSEVLVLSDHPELHSSQRLVEEIRKKGLSVDFLNPYTYALELDGSLEKKSHLLGLHRLTGIRHGDYDLSVAQSLENSGAKICNSIEAFHLLRGKERQALFFARNNFPFIPTYSFRGRPSSERLEGIQQFFKRNGFDSDQFVLKTLRGNQGIGVNLVRGLDSLSSLLETFWAIQDQDFLIQPFIKIDEEYRIFSIAGKIEGALHRKPASGEFRSNSARGEGSALSPTLLPEKIHSLTHELWKKSKASYAGIDLLKKGEEFLIIEYNLVPGFHQMEQLTQKNIAAKIVEAAIKEIP